MLKNQNHGLSLKKLENKMESRAEIDKERRKLESNATAKYSQLYTYIVIIDCKGERRRVLHKY
jgi:hypothetical protein